MRFNQSHFAPFLVVFLTASSAMADATGVTGTAVGSPAINSGGTSLNNGANTGLNPGGLTTGNSGMNNNINNGVNSGLSNGVNTGLNTSLNNGTSPSDLSAPTNDQSLSPPGTLPTVPGTSNQQSGIAGGTFHTNNSGGFVLDPGPIGQTTTAPATLASPSG